ncbi:unnamed protein product [Cuscuta epithymum]|uniref:feruloyl-CoA 6-hydroxylase n=1 Tax=Cuscuta epithymum TaxID=186058 RepID=A0AAV0CND7_9ASTE|nr:unnamed protein product [Cuscuta epithymum]
MAEPYSAGSDDPPFMEKYKNLFQRHGLTTQARHEAAEELELPLIDLGELSSRDGAARKECKRRIARASREWGFFQVVNHGIPPEVLENMRSEQVRLFRKAFEERERNMKVHFPDGNYQWGTPTATNLWQFSWSESFHVPLTDISNSTSAASQTNLRSTMGTFAARAAELAQRLAVILVEELGDRRCNYFQEKCPISTCYVRMNRYPPCPNHVFGLTPHTDSDFLTILHQDQIGGLHLVKDNRWISVKPKPTTLVINIGDLFQAWSNGVYKSVEHRVVANQRKERFSTAFFFCPSYHTTIQSSSQPSVYKTFTFGEFKRQVQEDVKNTGSKVGLPRFLAS